MITFVLHTRESVVVPNDSISISISQLSLGSYSGAISGFIVTLNRSSASFLCQIFRSKNSWKRFYHHEPASSNVFRSPFNSNPQFYHIIIEVFISTLFVIYSCALKVLWWTIHICHQLLHFAPEKISCQTYFDSSNFLN